MPGAAIVLFSALLGMLGGSACVKNTCRSNDDCVERAYCNPATGRCELRLDGGVDAGDGGSPDAGDAGPADAGDAGDAGDASPPCADHASCDDPAAPICDPGTHRCRPCQEGTAGDAECGARDMAQPACLSPPGICVQCTSSVLHCIADVDAPICDAATHGCRACQGGAAGDAECADRDPDTPVCDGAQGACVECTDSALHCAAAPLTPICDGASLECRGCADHTECAPPLGGGVCVVSSGRCLAEAEVIYVDADACPGPGTGSLIDPFCALQDGVDAATPGRSTVLVLAGTYEPISLVDTGTIWIVGEAGTQMGTGVNQSIVYVSGDVDLTLEGIRIFDAFGTGIGVECVGNVTTQPLVTLRGCTLTSNSGGGVAATSCTLTLDGNSISGNAGGGVSATSCTLTLDGNSISGNAGGGVFLSGSSFTLMNNFIVENGAATTYGGIRISSPGVTAVIAFNTVANNFASAGISAGVRCDDPVVVESSIATGNTTSDLSPSCAPSFCHTTPDGDPLFVGGGDYHLGSGSPCIDGGDPASTLDHDVDGQTRPQGSGPDIGADEAG